MSTIDKAAVLADEFLLTHKTNYDKGQDEQKREPRAGSLLKPVSDTHSVCVTKKTENATEKSCFYCKKLGI